MEVLDNPDGSRHRATNCSDPRKRPMFRRHITPAARMAESAIDAMAKREAAAGYSERITMNTIKTAISWMKTKSLFRLEKDAEKALKIAALATSDLASFEELAKAAERVAHKNASGDWALFEANTNNLLDDLASALDAVKKLEGNNG